MTASDKREQKIRQNPKNVSLEDFEWLVNKYGTIKMGGSHAKAQIGQYSLPYPRTNPIRTCYVKDLINKIDSLK
ncbi:hypothetical protein X792_05005 [Dehalococcoides mccartyi CG1]|jgi:hypothetical protein|uniref:hypothetical protein n=1 Tax=Dehalococcoides mccartyi TaxID=61435 RepID=UPI0004E05CBE|nr:hypothetical protein [Dehalococcoides mccartyi]AII58728.1 hypothetical protein X792_05005 [Dehalococcoides mccartyi CG1]